MQYPHSCCSLLQPLLLLQVLLLQPLMLPLPLFPMLLLPPLPRSCHSCCCCHHCCCHFLCCCCIPLPCSCPFHLVCAHSAVCSLMLGPATWSRSFGLRSCSPGVVGARCLSPLPGRTHLTPARGRSCSFALVRARLGSFVSRLYLYQIYGQYIDGEQTHLYIIDYLPV